MGRQRHYSRIVPVAARPCPGRVRHNPLYASGVIGFTHIRSELGVHRFPFDFSPPSSRASAKRSSARKAERPAASATTGGGEKTLVHWARNDTIRPWSSSK